MRQAVVWVSAHPVQLESIPRPWGLLLAPCAQQARTGLVQGAISPASAWGALLVSSLPQWGRWIRLCVSRVHRACTGPALGLFQSPAAQGVLLEPIQPLLEHQAQQPV